MSLSLAATPRVSFLISTYNRRDVLLGTLGQIVACGLRPEDYEILVVDNGSTDGTADAVAEAFPHVRLFRLKRNAGPCSKNLALSEAVGEFAVFLDDDSYPAPGSIERMIAHFEADPYLGGAIFTVTLPDGSQECSAYPNVFIGCGTGFRRQVVEKLGGLPEDYFMAAEEYVLSLRMMDAGWDIQRFDDLHVTHLKTPSSRNSRRITRLDVRNNITLAMRMFPPQWAVLFAREWTARYRLIAASKGHRLAFAAGVMQGIWRAMQLWKRTPIDEWTFEAFARLDETRDRLQRAAEQHGLKTVLLLDYGKNIYAWYRAARELGLQIVAIADNRLCGPGRTYRDIPIIDDTTARTLQFDAAVVSNLSPVHARQRAAAWSHMDIRPVIDLFADDRYAEPAVVTPDAVQAAWESRRTAARSA